MRFGHGVLVDIELLSVGRNLNVGLVLSPFTNIGKYTRHETGCEMLWHAQPPFCHDECSILIRIELCITAAQMLLAKTAQFCTAREAFGEKPETLEDSTIAEFHCVFDELLVAAIFASQIGCEAIRYMPDAAADRWVIEHVDDRSVHV